MVQSNKTAALVIDIQSFEGMDRQDAHNYSRKLGARVDHLRAQNIPVVWISIAPGGQKLLPPLSSNVSVQALDVLEDMGFDGHNASKKNHDIYATFLQDFGPRQNEVIYRKPAMSALATADDILDMQKILADAGIKLGTKWSPEDNKQHTKYIQPHEVEPEFKKLFAHGPSLHEYLQSKGIKSLELMGAVSKYCVAETAMSSVAKGYSTSIRSDLVLSWKYPVTSVTRGDGVLVWGDFDHESLIKESISNEINNPERQLNKDINKAVRFDNASSAPIKHSNTSHFMSAAKNAGSVLVLGLAVGSVSALQGASSEQIKDNVIETAIPGWGAAKQGKMCKSFGEVAGMLASGGIAVAITPPVVAGAIGVTAASGPFAPIVGPAAEVGATALVISAADITNRTVIPAAQASCEIFARTLNRYF